MKFVLLFSLLIFSCKQSYNSNSNDDFIYAPSTAVGDTPFQNAFLVLRNKCMSCHYYHQEWSDYTTEAQWTAAGLAANMNPTQSRVYNYLAGVPGSVSDMPKGSSPLSKAEINTIKDWIKHIGI
jgi:hypothetical protein